MKCQYCDGNCQKAGRQKNGTQKLYCGTWEVVDFVVVKRSKRTLRMLIDMLLLSRVDKIRTDNLGIYQALIPDDKHIHGAYCINHIERKNLSIRTHLKRLRRRTICFSGTLSY